MAGAWFVPVISARKPNVVVPFGARVPLYDMFLTVTEAPELLCEPFHTSVICWPLGQVHSTLHPDQEVEVLFLIFTSPLKPPGHDSITAYVAVQAAGGSGSVGGSAGMGAVGASGFCVAVLEGVGGGVAAIAMGVDVLVGVGVGGRGEDWAGEESDGVAVGLASALATGSVASGDDGSAGARWSAFKATAVRMTPKKLATTMPWLRRRAGIERRTSASPLIGRRARCPELPVPRSGSSGFDPLFDWDPLLDWDPLSGWGGPSGCGGSSRFEATRLGTSVGSS